MNEIDIKIGDLVRSFRLKQGISITDLASFLNISPQQVQKYEKGSSRLHIYKLKDICDLLNISLSYFIFQLENNDLKKIERPTLQFSLMKSFNKLNNEDKTILNSLAKQLSNRSLYNDKKKGK